MSYDVSIGDFDVNYTSNVGAVFHDHIKEGEVTGLQALNSLYGFQASEILYRAWSNLNATRHAMYKDGEVGEPAMEAKYNAANGWGSLVGALVTLGKITAACATYPHEVVHVSA
jgi:hypothetical protein